MVKHTLSDLMELSDFFQLIQDLYNFFKIPQIDKLYEGRTLKRLITTRWDGHFSSLKVISKYVEEIRATLKECRTSRSVDPENREKAKGYLTSLEEPVTIFLMTFVMDVLKLLSLLSLKFQKQDSNLGTALSTLGSVRKEVDNLLSEYTVEHITRLVYPQEASTRDDGSSPPAKRKRIIPVTFQDFVVSEKLPAFRDENNTVEHLRALAVEVVDKLNVEFDHRFSEFNSTLWKSYEILMPCNNHFLEPELLVPLFDFIKTIPAVCHKVTEFSFEQLKSECSVFRGVLKEFSETQDKLYEKALEENLRQEAMGKKVVKVKKEDKMTQTTRFVLTLAGAEILKQIYLVAVTAGYSSSVVECGFSARNRIDTCHRRRMTPYRQANLTLLHFENTLTRNITFEQFLVKWNSKPRRLVVSQ